MTNITKSRVAGALLAVVLTLFTGFGLAAPASAAPLSAAQAECGDTSGFTVVALSSLPAEATDTYELIQQGGPYPYEQDGTVFQNREGLLPACASGYYHEYTVETPGSDDRGARRIVTGSAGEYFYTGDHYASFDLVDVNS
ncbi:ribonuclease domain-containing protein [Amycolatopsis thermoflava]|uniref:ribonuclease domain-containing protein n=1 Tax=Amycolatopsis thermoflava TaxID=84480 RepID=UPI00381A15EC